MIDMKLNIDYKTEELNELRAELARTNTIGMKQSDGNSQWMDDVLKEYEQVRIDNESRRAECQVLRDQKAHMDEQNRAVHRQLQVAVSITNC
jgi:hypothetical protein